MNNKEKEKYISNLCKDFNITREIAIFLLDNDYKSWEDIVGNGSKFSKSYYSYAKIVKQVMDATEVERIYQYARKMKRLPEAFGKGDGKPKQLYSFRLRDTHIEAFPSTVKVKYKLDLSDSVKLTTLPSNFRVGKLILSRCTSLKSLPDNLHVNFLIIDRCTSLEDLNNVKVEIGGISAINCTKLKEIPKCDIISLNIKNCTQITELPEGMIVDSMVELGNSSVRKLPDSMKDTPIYWNGNHITPELLANPEMIDEHIKNQESKAKIDKYADISIENYEKWFNLASSMTSGDRLEIYTKLTEVAPDFALGWMAKGYILSDMASYFFDYYSKNVDDKDYSSKSEKALKRIEESLKCYEKGESLGVVYREVKDSFWFQKGYALRKTGRLKEAAECYQKILNSDSLHHQTRKILEELDEYTFKPVTDPTKDALDKFLFYIFDPGDAYYENFGDEFYAKHFITTAEKLFDKAINGASQIVKSYIQFILTMTKTKLNKIENRNNPNSKKIEHIQAKLKEFNEFDQNRVFHDEPEIDVVTMEQTLSNYLLSHEENKRLVVLSLFFRTLNYLGVSFFTPENVKNAVVIAESSSGIKNKELVNYWEKLWELRPEISTNYNYDVWEKQEYTNSLRFKRKY